MTATPVNNLLDELDADHVIKIIHRGLSCRSHHAFDLHCLSCYAGDVGNHGSAYSI